MMNKDYRGITLQYACATDSAYKHLFEGADYEQDNSFEGLTEIKSASLVSELYGQGVMLETNIGKLYVVSAKDLSEELVSSVLEEGGLDKVLNECYCYRKEDVSESRVQEGLELEEGDFLKDKDGTVYVVADIYSRHVAIFDIKNNVKVISSGDVKKYKIVNDGKEFNSLSKKFDSVTTGSKYLKYSLNESTQTSNTQAGNKIDCLNDDEGLIGKAYEFEDGIFVVTDVIDGVVYLLGPDDDMYQISVEDFNSEVIREVEDDGEEEEK